MPAVTTETIDVAVPPDVAFDYVANFGRLVGQDPTFDRADRTDAGVLGPGSTFVVSIAHAGEPVPITYTILEFERPGRLVLAGEAKSFASTDELRFSGNGTGTTVHYRAEVDTDLPAWRRAVSSPVLAMLGRLSARVMSRAAQRP